MNYTIYPTDLLVPEKLANGDEWEIALDNPSSASWGVMAGQDPVIYIRIASPASPNLSVRIKAREIGGASAGTWNPILTETNVPMPIHDQFHDPMDYAGQVQGFGYDTGSEVLWLTISVKYGSADGTEWLMQITNVDSSSVEQNFVCVVAKVEGEDEKPWIDVYKKDTEDPPATTLEFDVLIREDPSETDIELRVNNYGTGPLTLNSVNLPPASPFTLPAMPITISANTFMDIPVAFNAPSTPHEQITEPSVSFSSNDDPRALMTIGHNKQFELKAITRALEVMLLLDASGSMGWAPDGTFLPAGSIDSRWYEMKSAVKLFLDLLAAFGHEHGKFGIARFPIDSSVSPPIFDVVPPTDIPVISDPVQPDMDQHKATLDGVTPENNTPMGDGLAHVLPLNPSYFSTDPTDEAVNRRWLLLFSDGANNSGTVNPVSFIPPDTRMVDNRIKLYAVGYGTENAPSHSVDWDLLNGLADASFESDGTNKCQVDVENKSAEYLASALKIAILASLSPELTSPSDPSGILYSDMPEARHQVIITQHDTKAAFTLHWNKPDTERMKLQLLTPRCELITPESASGGSGESGITFSKELRYQMYTVDHKYLRNASDPSRPRYGTWTLLVSSDKLGRGDSESYTHNVIVKSRLRMDVRTDRGVYYAGDPIGLSAILTLNGRRVKNAAVIVRVDIPGHFVKNWLAGAAVSAQEYQKAAKTLAGQDVTPLFIKAYAARRKGITFKPFTTSETIAMNDPSGQGVYEATTKRTWLPGGYTFYITAIGQTEDGVMFRREKKVQVGVSVRPEPEYTLFDVQYHRIPDSGPGVIGADITVWPRDRFGNVVLVDPAYNPCIEIMVRGKKPEGKLVGNMDGSYSQTVRFAAGKIPGIGLKVSGREVVRELHLPPVDRLHYVDRVIDFRKGSEAEEGANKYGDPQAVLGDVTEKDRERFVSLGGFGSITVGFQGQAILASGKAEDDITVFVRRDEDLRPYVVEAQRRPARDKWVELGVSPGVTQSFSLGKAGLRKATAVRITARSGRTTDSEGKPIATPGVSIRGVGVRRVGHVLASYWASCLVTILRVIIRWLFRRGGL